MACNSWNNNNVCVGDVDVCLISQSIFIRQCNFTSKQQEEMWQAAKIPNKVGHLKTERQTLLLQMLYFFFSFFFLLLLIPLPNRKFRSLLLCRNNRSRSEYDTESYWKSCSIVFQERYGHRGSSEPASVNIIDLNLLGTLTKASGLT